MFAAGGTCADVNRAAASGRCDVAEAVSVWEGRKENETYQPKASTLIYAKDTGVSAKSSDGQGV